jgi:hypothetical protein
MGRAWDAAHPSPDTKSLQWAVKVTGLLYQPFTGVLSAVNVAVGAVLSMST